MATFTEEYDYEMLMEYCAFLFFSIFLGSKLNFLLSHFHSLFWQFYLGKRVAYVYKGARKINESKVCIGHPQLSYFSM